MNYGYACDWQLEHPTVAIKWAAASAAPGGRVLIGSREFSNPTAQNGGGVFVFAKPGLRRHN
jgi:hypothetical protein